MSRCARAFARLTPLTIALAAIAVAPADAWQVKVYVHGAGKIAETDGSSGAPLMNCTVPTSGRSNESVTQCFAGTQSGRYSHGEIIELEALVPAEHHERGWRFQKWVERTEPGSVNCDPQGPPEEHLSPRCKFQIWENLAVDLFFADIAGPQDTAILSGPPFATNSTVAAFAFDSEDPDASYECRLSRPGTEFGAWALCGSPSDKSETYTGLSANGPYAFEVRGKDPSGNLDGAPASWSWRVDTLAPTVAIGGLPPDGSVTSATSATPTVSPSEPGSTVTCVLDDAVMPCSGTRSGLLDGSHTFRARATDLVGNVGHWVTRSWRVDTVPPGVNVDSGPVEGSTRADDEAVVAFSSPDPSATFECRIDDSPGFTACTSPVGFTDLADGEHTFAVRAVDEAGNMSAVASRSWTVDTVAPTTMISAGPAEGVATSITEATFAFGSTDTSARFECALDTGGFVPCTSPVRHTGLAIGGHAFAVRARDAVGNVEPSPAVRRWVVVAAPAPLVPSPGPGLPSAGGPLGAAGGSPATADDRLPAKLKVRRAGIVDGKLDVLAEMTTAANGDAVEIAFRARGHTFRFTEEVDGGRVRFRRTLPNQQRGARSGIATYTYAGSDRVRPTEVRLRAANGKARLKRTRLTLEDGVLRVGGTIDRRARGVVRLSLEHLDEAGAVATWEGRATIKDGEWSLTETLPGAAAAGGYLSIQFTGYRPRGIRGEQDAKQIP